MREGLDKILMKICKAVRNAVFTGKKKTRRISGGWQSDTACPFFSKENFQQIYNSTP
jgi:hypothetical protein